MRDRGNQVSAESLAALGWLGFGVDLERRVLCFVSEPQRSQALGLPIDCLFSRAMFGDRFLGLGPSFLGL